MRHKFEAFTGVNCSSFYENETLKPLAASAIIEEFLGSVSPEAHPHTIAHVQQHLNGDSGSSFELVLDLILDGLVRLAGGPEQSASA